MQERYRLAHERRRAGYVNDASDDDDAKASDVSDDDDAPIKRKVMFTSDTDEDAPIIVVKKRKNVKEDDDDVPIKRKVMFTSDTDEDDPIIVVKKAKIVEEYRYDMVPRKALATERARRFAPSSGGCRIVNYDNADEPIAPFTGLKGVRVSVATRMARAFAPNFGGIKK